MSKRVQTHKSDATQHSKEYGYGAEEADRMAASDAIKQRNHRKAGEAAVDSVVEIDNILDEIDSVLEENASVFIAQFEQRGGE